MAKKVKARTQAHSKGKPKTHHMEAAGGGPGGSAASAVAESPAPASSSTLWLDLRILSLVFALLALGVSGYLAYNEAFGGNVACIQAAGFDCDLVQSSSYSEIFGIKVAYTGLAANLLVVLMLAFEPRVDFLKENGPILLFGILLFGIIFSIWLVYVQAVLLRSFCQWCLLHELAYLGLFVLGILRLRKALG